MTGVLIRREDTETASKSCEDGGIDRNYSATSQELPGATRAEGGKEGFFPRDFRGNMALLTP